MQVLKYVQMKKDCPELFQVSPIDELEFLLDMQMQWMLPERDANGGRQVYIFRVGMFNCNNNGSAIFDP